MTDDELEWRLRAVLRDRAVRAEPRLSGPELRRAAEARGARSGPRRPVAVLASAAAVVGIAAGVAVLAGGGDDPRPVPPAGPVSTVPTPAAPPISPPVTTPTVPGPTVSAPTVTAPTVSAPTETGPPNPSPTAVLGPSASSRSATGTRPEPTRRTTPRAPSTAPATR